MWFGFEWLGNISRGSGVVSGWGEKISKVLKKRNLANPDDSWEHPEIIGL